jgi:copper chaperone
MMYELKVDGMTCEGCVASVKKSVLHEDPNARVKIDLSTGLATIESKLPEMNFKTAIEDAGFTIRT